MEPRHARDANCLRLPLKSVELIFFVGAQNVSQLIFNHFFSPVPKCDFWSNLSIPRRLGSQRRVAVCIITLDRIPFRG